MDDLASVRVLVFGLVQGVFFRAFVAEKATELGVKGYVRNIPGGKSVEVSAEGQKEKLERLTSYLKTGPPSARVKKVEIYWSKYSEEHSGFNIKY